MVCENNREYFRDVYDHLVRINGTLETLRDTIGTADSGEPVDGDDRRVRNHQASWHAWAGIFAVATAFAGIWGMKLPGPWPET